MNNAIRYKWLIGLLFLLGILVASGYQMASSFSKQEEDLFGTLVACVLEVREAASDEYILRDKGGALTVYHEIVNRDGITIGLISGVRLDKETKIYDVQGNSAGMEAISPGDSVEVRYGFIQDSYPYVYASVARVRVLGRSDEQLYEKGKEELKRWRRD